MSTDLQAAVTTPSDFSNASSIAFLWMSLLVIRFAVYFDFKRRVELVHSVYYDLAILRVKFHTIALAIGVGVLLP
jgi:hypothetical protein